jgi:hypothetical protein
MSDKQEIDGAQANSRKQGDLGRQYRPIGIGAVAAAVTARKLGADDGQNAANSNERIGTRETIAA